MSSYFYLHAQMKMSNESFINDLEGYAEKNKKLVYVLDKPLGDQKYTYNYSDGLIVLSPKNKIRIIDFGNNTDSFKTYYEDIIEDLGYISDKYLYKKIIGRTRDWKRYIESLERYEESESIDNFFQNTELNTDSEKKVVELLISLFIGSINDIEKVKEQVPVTLLDKVKQKIQLFDGDQTRFIYQSQETENKTIRIQGLSGTGKTELLLHKLKELYTTSDTSKIFFTCHNKVLSNTLKERIPAFFNFMRVEQQIQWEKRLWCSHAWGGNVTVGLYSYLCAFYHIPIYSYSGLQTFGQVCQMAIDCIQKIIEEDKFEYALDYVLIDESQDFDDKFIELCVLVTQEKVYIAGDIFQSIFDNNILQTISPDYLLGKCYRTDPRTLMFAHALGMGLFEEKKLRWLEVEEWQGCGYNVDNENGHFHLSREPLRRFEDIDENHESIEILDLEDNIFSVVITTLKQIKAGNVTVTPDDIGIIFLDSAKSIYKEIDILEKHIQNEFDWSVNRAYESKNNISNTLFISNRNNVKGLEFPFVICITSKIFDSSSYRNSLYTMLTRSFIKSYFIIPNTEASGMTPMMREGLKQILRTNEMVIKEPSREEKALIQTRFEKIISQSTFDERVKSILQERNIDMKHLSKCFKLIENMNMINSNDEDLARLIESNKSFLSRQ